MIISIETPDFVTYSAEGEHWLGFEAVRDLMGLPEQILLVLLPGHTRGHCGVAVQGDAGWLLDAGDAYFDARQVHQPVPQPVPQVGLRVGLFERVVTTDKRLRLYNQASYAGSPRPIRRSRCSPRTTPAASRPPSPDMPNGRGFSLTPPRPACRRSGDGRLGQNALRPPPCMTEGAKMRSCCPIPAFTRCPQKAGSYPHVTAVIHWLIHTLLTLTRSNSENTVTWSP